MNLSGNYFTYGSQSSKTYGLRILHKDTKRMTQLGSNISYQTVFNRGTKRFAFSGIEYGDPLEFEIEFISEEPISRDKERRIKAWLFNKKEPDRLYADKGKDETKVLLNGVVKREYLNCVFYNPSEIRAANGLRGWSCTCLVDGTMANQEEVEITLTDFTNPVTVTVDTDIDDYVYPELEITMGAGDGQAHDITITNTTDSSRAFSIADVTAQATVLVDCARGTAYYNVIPYQSCYDAVANKRFLRLLPGDNTLSIAAETGGAVASVKIKFSNARYVV